MSGAIPRGLPPNRDLLPGAVPFASRTALSLLIAYYVSFATQIQSASTAGLCVAIIAQPAAGMAISKAGWRLLGTLLGGLAGVTIVACFPQDRTLLLAAYALWLGLCAFVAGLLRDFRAYGAVLSGYTAGVIAIAAIDAPQTALLVALDRVAAMLIGVASVLGVNLLLGGAGAQSALLADLRKKAAIVTANAADALNGQPLPNEFVVLQTPTSMAAFRTQAAYAGAELPDGQVRRNGAHHAIAALLAMVSASRLVSHALAVPQPVVFRSYLETVANVIRGGGPRPLEPVAADPVQHLLILCAGELLRSRAALEAGLLALEGAGERLPRVDLPTSYDVEGAVWAAVRAIVATGLCGVFSVLAGWSGATLVLIQSSAIIALVGTMPNPAAASLTFPVALVPSAFVVGIVNFLVLPGTSGFVPFALAIGSLTWVATLILRHARLAPYAPAALLLSALLLGPSNQQTFDFGAYANTVLEVAVDLLFVVLAFRLISEPPGRRRSRVAAQIVSELCRTLFHGSATAIRPLTSSTHHDRLARVIAVPGLLTSSKLHQLRHLHWLGELDATLRHALLALSQLASVQPDLAPLLVTAEQSLRAADPNRILEVAQDLADASPRAARLAVSYMAATALQLRHDPSGLRFFRRLME